LGYKLSSNKIKNNTYKRRRHRNIPGIFPVNQQHQKWRSEECSFSTGTFLVFTGSLAREHFLCQASQVDWQLTIAAVTQSTVGGR
jgi:hypothetical protein